MYISKPVLQYDVNHLLSTIFSVIKSTKLIIANNGARNKPHFQLTSDPMRMQTHRNGAINEI